MIRLIKLFCILFFINVAALAQINSGNNNIGSDLESLGLDNVANEPIKTDQKINQQPSKENNKKTKQPIKSAIKNNKATFVNKKNSKLIKPKKNKLKESENAVQNIDNQQQDYQEQKMTKQDLQELDELRKIYISNIYSSEQQQQIIPHKKNFDNYMTEELPPIPILNRSRSADNMHIPFVTTPKENIEIMFQAIKLRDISFFNEIFKYVQNPNITNEQGDTVLTAAIISGDYSIIASVLAKGADPNMPNRLGYNPVTIAIEINNFEILYLLAKNKADLLYRDAFNRTYLMQAARVGSLSAVDLLLRVGVDINATDNDGFTALAIAKKYRQDLVVQYLIKNNAKI